MASHYDAIIIGSGQSGNPLAPALAKAGRKVALFERKHVGGSCINYGCTPTKAMIAGAKVARYAQTAADFGIEVHGWRTDMPAVFRRQREIVVSFREAQEKKLREAGVTLIFEEARFIGPKRIEAGGEEFEAEMVFINTGSRPRQLSVPGLDKAGALDSTSILELRELPEKLLVLGGGYIGLEMAQMFRRLGSEVSIVESAGRLLSNEDEDVSEGVHEVMESEGIELLLGREAVEAGEGFLKLDDGRTLDGSHILVSIGQTPNTDGLNLASAGVEVDDKGYVKVNGRLETAAEGVYAMGDVKGGPAFTHVSYDDYRVLRENILHGGDASAEGRLLVYTVFIDPQLGRVGPSEKQAREEGRDFKVARLEMSASARAIETGDTRGFMKALVDSETDAIIGAAVLGVDGGEVMSVLQMAILAGMSYQKVRDAVFAHPTAAESLNNLFKSL